jgi:hypothetical protein
LDEYAERLWRSERGLENMLIGTRTMGTFSRLCGWVSGCRQALGLQETRGLE